jgi:hypothetical protein
MPTARSAEGPRVLNARSRHASTLFRSSLSRGWRQRLFFHRRTRARGRFFIAALRDCWGVRRGFGGLWNRSCVWHEAPRIWRRQCVVSTRLGPNREDNPPARSSLTPMIGPAAYRLARSQRSSAQRDGSAGHPRAQPSGSCDYQPAKLAGMGRRSGMSRLGEGRQGPESNKTNGVV